MLAYKLKVINVEYETLSLLPIRKNGNTYPSIDNNYGADYVTELLYGRDLCGTVIPKKAIFRRKKYIY